MNLEKIQDLLDEFSKDSNSVVRKYAKNSLAIINDESIDLKSTITSTNKSIRSKKQKPKKYLCLYIF